jgi:hypothetical protein
MRIFSRRTRALCYGFLANGGEFLKGLAFLFRLGSGRNVTTRDRQLEHEGPNILCFGIGFPLTEFPHLFTLRRQIRGIVFRRADNLSP